MTDINDTTLTVADIANLKQIVEVATSRGAFQAGELSQVGAVYDKVCVWLQSAMPPVETEQTEAEQGESEDA